MSGILNIHHFPILMYQSFYLMWWQFLISHQKCTWFLSDECDKFQITSEIFLSHQHPIWWQVHEDVKRWLNDVVRLKEYESIFVSNGIDSMEIVKSLNKDYLKEMGITKIGHQIKFLNAVDALKWRYTDFKIILNPIIPWYWQQIQTFCCFVTLSHHYDSLSIQ